MPGFLAWLSGPSQKWTMQSRSSKGSDAAAAQRSVWAAKLPNNQHTYKDTHEQHKSQVSTALRRHRRHRLRLCLRLFANQQCQRQLRLSSARAEGEFELRFSSFLARVRCGSLSLLLSQSKLKPNPSNWLVRSQQANSLCALPQRIKQKIGSKVLNIFQILPVKIFENNNKK